MTAQELGTVLRYMYRGADKGSAVVMVHLFGVKYAALIRQSGANASDIVRAANMSESYAREIQKGINLAKYVEVKPSA